MKKAGVLSIINNIRTIFNYKFTIIKMIFVFFFVLVLISFITSFYVTINRQELGITNDKYDEEDRNYCEGYDIPNLWALYDEPIKKPRLVKGEVQKITVGQTKIGYPNYDRQVVALGFAAFAAYANNAYHDLPRSAISFNKVLPFEGEVKSYSEKGGFRADLYIDEDGGEIEVMIVFRGTDGLFAFNDHLSNLSFLLQMISPWDQYETARNYFKTIREDIKKRAQQSNKKIRYLAVGHSLGGGLARHIGYAFPCVSVIAFNSSFITNRYRLAKPYHPLIVDLFEAEDRLTIITGLWQHLIKDSVMGEQDSLTRVNQYHQFYNLNNIIETGNPHSILSAAETMAKMPVDCFVEEKDPNNNEPRDCKIDSPMLGSRCGLWGDSECRANPVRKSEEEVIAIKKAIDALLIKND